MSSALRILMFTDQVRSTANTAKRSPAEIRQVSQDQERLTASVVRHCEGRIIGSRGDGAFIEFHSCDDAVRCAALLQQRVQARNETLANPLLRFELHIGIDVGEVETLASGEVQGNAANRAARVCAACPPGMVYFTQKVRDELHPGVVESERLGGSALKGVPGKVVLHRLVAYRGEMGPAHNPFVWRSGVADPSAFFNRRREQSMLQDFLYNRQNCQIVGPRRIGKSSLLRQIEHMAPQWDRRIVLAYIDLQAPQCYTLAGWLKLVSRRLRLDEPIEDLSGLAECIERLLSEGRQPVLCLDEFGELILRAAEFTRDFLMTLRACGQLGMSIITASQRPLHELTEGNDHEASPFYNTFPLLRLGRFSPEDAASYVALHRPGVPPFNEDERLLILEAARNHPLGLQVACFHVLEAKKHGERILTALRRAEEDMRAHVPDW